MKTASVKELKSELEARTSKELIELCLSLSKFKKENKELLTYLLYESENEDAFIKNFYINFFFFVSLYYSLLEFELNVPPPETEIYI